MRPSVRQTLPAPPHPVTRPSSHSGAPPHRTPLQWSNAAINSLLDLVDCPKDERDPLALKQAISTLQPELSSLKLKQRKAVQVALEAQLQAAARASLPSRLHVDAPAAPAKVEAPSRPRPPVPASATGPPRVGTEAGYEWTQSEAELTLTVPLPEGTSKSDIVLQMTPRFGPAQTLVLHARFWPLPLLCGELCGQVEASETMPSQYAESAASQGCGTASCPGFLELPWLPGAGLLSLLGLLAALRTWDEPAGRSGPR